MTRERGWFCGCPQCGMNLYVRNAGIVRDGGSCPNCADFGTEEDDETYPIDSLVSTELGWCGCGRPEDVDDVMLRYLNESDETILRRPDDMDEMLWYVLAYIADDLGWTEHGGSVGGAWLTDEGHEARLNLRKAALVRSSSGE